MEISHQRQAPIIHSVTILSRIAIIVNRKQRNVGQEKSFIYRITHDLTAGFTALLFFATLALAVAAFYQTSDAHTAASHAEANSSAQLQVIPEFENHHVVVNISNYGDGAAEAVRIVCIARLINESNWNFHFNVPLVLPTIGVTHRLSSHGGNAREEVHRKRYRGFAPLWV